MPRTISFHLDEHCPKALSRGLRRLGVDLTTTREAGLSGEPDEVQLEYSNRTNRVIFTQDDDFLRLHSAGVPHAGIVYCHQHSRSLGEIIQGLVLVWEIHEPETMRNQVEYL